MAVVRCVHSVRINHPHIIPWTNKGRSTQRFRRHGMRGNSFRIRRDEELSGINGKWMEEDTSNGLIDTMQRVWNLFAHLHLNNQTRMFGRLMCSQKRDK